MICYAFYKFLQNCNTIEVPPFTRVPRKNQPFADGSLVGTKHPIKKSGLGIVPLAMGGGGLAGIRRRSRPGKRRGMTASSPRTDWQARSGRGSTPRRRTAATGGDDRGGSAFRRGGWLGWTTHDARGTRGVYGRRPTIWWLGTA
jgi:hypothetical protein